MICVFTDSNRGAITEEMRVEHLMKIYTSASKYFTEQSVTTQTSMVLSQVTRSQAIIYGDMYNTWMSTLQADPPPPLKPRPAVLS